MYFNSCVSNRPLIVTINKKYVPKLWYQENDVHTLMHGRSLTPLLGCRYDFLTVINGTSPACFLLMALDALNVILILVPTLRNCELLSRLYIML